MERSAVPLQEPAAPAAEVAGDRLLSDELWNEGAAAWTTCHPVEKGPFLSTLGGGGAIEALAPTAPAVERESR